MRLPALWTARIRFIASLNYVWGAMVLGAATVYVIATPGSHLQVLAGLDIHLPWLMPGGSTAKREMLIRWWATLLQGVGVVMLVRDLRGAQRQFGQAGLLARVRQKLAQWPRGKPVYLAANGLAVSMTLSSGRLTQRTSAPDDADLEVKLQAIVANMAFIDQDLAAARAEIDKEIGAREAALKAEAAARNASLEALRRDMVETAVGSFAFSMFGVVWLAIGLVLSGTAQDIARWANAALLG